MTTLILAAAILFLVSGWICAVKVLMEDSFPGGIIDYATRILPPLYVVTQTEFVDKLGALINAF